jgi:predicted nuclease with TOPRIM domain
VSNNNDWLKEKLEKMDGKLDKTDERLDHVYTVLTEQAVTLGKQSIILEDHTRRSLANEEAVKLAKNVADIALETLRNELKPIQRERYMVKGAMKIVGVLIGAGSVIGGIVKFLLTHS